MAFFAVKTNFYAAEMKPLQKPVRWTLRIVMVQKTIYSLFAQPAKVREKRFNAAWKIYGARAFFSSTSKDGSAS
jgi:hypothetical protein